MRPINGLFDGLEDRNLLLPSLITMTKERQ